MRVQTFIPYAVDWNLGAQYNEVMRSLDEDDWAILLDHDAMFTTGVWYRQILDAIEREPRGTFTGLTNRIGKEDSERWQRAPGIDPENHDMTYHRRYGAARVEIPYLQNVTDEYKLLGGVLIVISKESWSAIEGFRDGMLGVDYACHLDLQRAGRRVFCIQGLYLYHWKRADGQKFPDVPPIFNWRDLLDDGDPRRAIPTVMTAEAND